MGGCSHSSRSNAIVTFRDVSVWHFMDRDTASSPTLNELAGKFPGGWLDRLVQCNAGFRVMSGFGMSALGGEADIFRISAKVRV